MNGFRAWLRSFRCSHAWEAVEFGGGDYYTEDGRIHVAIGRRTVHVCPKCGQQKGVFWALAFVPKVAPND